MADTTNTAAATETQPTRRNEKVGTVVSTKMQKTIVVEIEIRKAHPKYKRVMKSNKKFYAHDELNSARVGDVVRIREARPYRSSSAGRSRRSCAGPHLRTWTRRARWTRHSRSLAGGRVPSAAAPKLQGV